MAVSEEQTVVSKGEHGPAWQGRWTRRLAWQGCDQQSQPPPHHTLQVSLSEGMGGCLLGGRMAQV